MRTFDETADMIADRVRKHYEKLGRQVEIIYDGGLNTLSQYRTIRIEQGELHWEGDTLVYPTVLAECKARISDHAAKYACDLSFHAASATKINTVSAAGEIIRFINNQLQ